MLPAIPVIGALGKAAAAVGAAVTTAPGAAAVGACALGGAKAFAAREVTKQVATIAAVAAGLGPIAGGVILGGLTIWQLGKLGSKLLSKDDKK